MGVKKENWLKIFMQTKVGVTCMQTNYLKLHVAQSIVMAGSCMTTQVDLSKFIILTDCTPSFNAAANTIDGFCIVKPSSNGSQLLLYTCIM